MIQLIAEPGERKNAYVAVVDQASLLKLKGVLAGATACAIDTESTSKDPRKAILLGVALSTEPGHAFYIPMTKPDLRDISVAEVTATLHDILSKRLIIIGHNLKYDYVLLRRNGIRIATPHFDTMLAAHECFGDWDYFNLGAVAKRILNINLKRYRDIVEPSHRFEDIPFKDQLQHGCSDVDATLRLYAPLRKLLKEKAIEYQYTSDVMPLMQLLGDKEVKARISGSRTRQFNLPLDG
jgi:DNA polymerase-1